MATKDYSWWDLLTSPEPYTGFSASDYFDIGSAYDNVKDTTANDLKDIAYSIAGDAVNLPGVGLASIPIAFRDGPEAAGQFVTDEMSRRREGYAPSKSAQDKLDYLGSTPWVKSAGDTLEKVAEGYGEIGSLHSPEAGATAYAAAKAAPVAAGGYGLTKLGGKASRALDDVYDTSGINNQGRIGKQSGVISRPLKAEELKRAESEGLKPIRHNVKGRPYDEILDFDMKMSEDGFRNIQDTSAPAKNAVQLPMFDVRPELGEMGLMRDSTLDPRHAYFDPKKNVVGLSAYDAPGSDSAIGNVSHEMTHAATQTPGYPVGGGPEHGSSYRLAGARPHFPDRTDPEYLAKFEENLKEIQAKAKSIPDKIQASKRAQEKTDKEFYPDATENKKYYSSLTDRQSYEHLTDEYIARASAERAQMVKAMEDDGKSREFIQAEMEKTPLIDPVGVPEGKLIDYFDDSTISRAETAAPKKVLHRKKSGQYVGAPPEVRSPQKLGQIRNNYEDAVAQGVSGADWYHDSSKFIENVTNNPTQAQQVADTLAITSARTPVDANLGHTVKGVNQKLTDNPIKTGGFPNVMGPIIDDVLSGNKPPLGYKREPFAQNLSVNWSPEKGVRPVHDIWDGRAWGWTGKNGKPYDGGFSETQHAWMDEQAAILDERMNKKAIGGRTDWNPLRSQAAAWTGEKIKAGQVKPEDAAKHFGSYEDKYTANATHEQIPGAGTGHLEGIVDAPENVRRAYSDDVRSSWTDDKGRDQLYAQAGVLTGKTRKGQGLYTPENTGVTEFNPMAVSSPLLSRETGKGALKGSVDVGPWDKDIMNLTEATRAFVDAQNAGAWHTELPGNSAKFQKDVHIPIEGKVSKDTLRDVSDLAASQSMFATDTGGRGINLINDAFSDVGAKREGTQLGKDLRGDFGKSIQELTGTKPQRTRIASGYQDFEDVWPQGKGAATGRLLETLDINPAFARQLDTPQLREKARANMLRDVEYSDKYGFPLREDIQRTRKVISDEGLEGLRREFKKNPEKLAQVLQDIGGYT